MGCLLARQQQAVTCSSGACSSVPVLLPPPSCSSADRAAGLSSKLECSLAGPEGADTCSSGQQIRTALRVGFWRAILQHQASLQPGRL